MRRTLIGVSILVSILATVWLYMTTASLFEVRDHFSLECDRCMKQAFDHQKEVSNSRQSAEVQRILGDN